MQRYDYKILTRYIDDGTKWSWLGDGQGVNQGEYLKRLGREGWDLVSVVPTSERRGSNGRTEFLYFYLKKPI